MTYPELPHLLGIAGEVLNLAGAVCLAYDMVLRQSERAHGEELEGLGEFARKHGLIGFQYKGVDTSLLDFPQKVIDQRAAFFGYWGVALLAMGFMLLVGYHVSAMLIK